jgi:D-alanyl-D-alanine carboxypeptidase
MMTTSGFYIQTRSGRQYLKNHNLLLGRYYGMGPAKTGWTRASRHTYAASATREGRELHLIILNSPDKWTDAQEMFDFGFFRTIRTSIPNLASSYNQPTHRYITGNKKNSTETLTPNRPSIAIHPDPNLTIP